MSYEEITWCQDGHEITLGLDRAGAGSSVLLLPALSSISTRREMRPLQDRLARSFTTIAVDWPGFGELPRPFVDWRPEIYLAYLDFLLAKVVTKPYAVVAAGHAAGYVLRHYAGREATPERLVLLSPTWRGPLPTMMNGDRPVFPRIARAVDVPVLGQMLYYLNVNRPVVGLMARGHVYAEPGWLRGSRMDEKRAVIEAPGARHGSARFVTGCLDPFKSRDEFIHAAQRVSAPMLVAFSATAPRKSRAEMEALAGLSKLKAVRLPRGKLSFYEEFPDEAAEVTAVFLDEAKQS